MKQLFDYDPCNDKLSNTTSNKQPSKILVFGKDPDNDKL